MVGFSGLLSHPDPDIQSFPVSFDLEIHELPDSGKEKAVTHGVNFLDGLGINGNHPVSLTNSRFVGGPSRGKSGDQKRCKVVDMPGTAFNLNAYPSILNHPAKEKIVPHLVDGGGWNHI
jgi:hypothetical protein